MREDAAEVTEAPLDRGVLGGVRLLVVVGSLCVKISGEQAGGEIRLEMIQCRVESEQAIALQELSRMYQFAVRNTGGENNLASRSASVRTSM